MLESAHVIERVAAHLADLLTTHRTLALVAAVVVTVLAAAGAARLTFDDQPQRLFESREEIYDTLHQLFDSFGTDDRECIILIETEAPGATVFDEGARALIERLQDRLASVDGIARTMSYLDLIRTASADSESIRAAALESELIRGHFVAPDSTRTIVAAHLTAEAEGIEIIGPVVDRMREIIREEQGDLDVLVRITGIPPLRVDIIETLRRDQVRFFVIGAGLGILVAWVIFRHLAAVGIVILAPIVGSLWSLGLMGWIGEPVNVINATMPTLVMVIGFTDSVHLMVDLRHSRATGVGGAEAARRAIAHLGPACAMTSFTTFVGFGSLVVASVITIQRFGVACAAGVALTFVAVIVLVPLLSSLAPQQRLVDPQRFARINARRERRVRFLRPVLNHPRIVTAGGIAVTAILAAVAVQLRPDNSLAETLPRDLEAADALRVVDEHFGGILQVSVMISPRAHDDDARGIDDPRLIALLEEIHRSLDEAPHTTAALSLLTILRQMPGGDAPEELANRTRLLGMVPADIVGRLYDRETGRLVVRARVPDAGAAALEGSFAQIERDLDLLREAHPQYDLALTGTTTVATRNVRVMIGDLAASLGFAAIVIIAAVSIAFGSIRLGAISIVPNVFPLAATAALLVIVGLPLQVTSVIVFSVCLGIAVDDTIHFVARFVRERRDAGEQDDVRQAVERAFVRVGAALVITTVVLLCGFGAVVFSGVPAIRLYAVLSCFAIAAALVADLVILPAMLMCFAGRGGRGDATSFSSSAEPDSPRPTAPSPPPLQK